MSPSGAADATSLVDSLARSPSLLLQEDGAKLAKSRGAILERFENVVALGDIEGEHFRFVFLRGLEPLGCVIKSGVSQFADEREDEPIGDGYTCEHHLVSLYPRYSSSKRLKGQGGGATR